MQRVIVVTGARRGLGRALIERFQKDGHYAVAIVRPQINGGDDQIDFPPPGVTVYEADVSESAAVSKVVSQIVERFGSIDILFNNAAVYPKSSFLEETPNEWFEAVDINLNGIAYSIKATLPHMISRGCGKIFNVGSYADLNPIANSAAYSATKGAVRALTKAVAADVSVSAPDADIQIHEWIPGHIKSRMSEFTGIEPSVAAGWAATMILHDPGKMCTTYVNDQEWFPPKRLKDRLKDKVFFWRNEGSS